MARGTAVMPGVSLYDAFDQSDSPNANTDTGFGASGLLGVANVYIP